MRLSVNNKLNLLVVAIFGIAVAGSTAYAGLPLTQSGIDKLKVGFEKICPVEYAALEEFYDNGPINWNSYWAPVEEYDSTTAHILDTVFSPFIHHTEGQLKTTLWVFSTAEYTGKLIEFGIQLNELGENPEKVKLLEVHATSAEMKVWLNAAMCLEPTETEIASASPDISDVVAQLECNRWYEVGPAMAALLDQSEITSNDVQGVFARYMNPCKNGED